MHLGFICLNIFFSPVRLSQKKLNSEHYFCFCRSRSCNPSWNQWCYEGSKKMLRRTWLLNRRPSLRFVSMVHIYCQSMFWCWYIWKEVFNPLNIWLFTQVELTDIQKKYYRAILERNFSFLSLGANSNSNVPNLLNTMMELRKCCNHPYLINGMRSVSS